MKTLISIKILIYYFLVICFLSSCTHTPTSPVIARVGKSIMTVDDLQKSIPQEYSSQITIEQNINYVKQWIDAELLFQEALRNKIDKNPEIKKKLFKMKKDLLAAELINRQTLQHQTKSIDETTIHSFYEKHKNNYIREKNSARFHEIIVDDSRIAWYINKNGSPENFLTLAAEYSKQPIPENINIPYSIIDELPSEIQHCISITTIGTVSNPVKTDAGYHILLILDKRNAGEICAENEVREDIINQMISTSNKECIEQFLADLRLKNNIIFNSEILKNINHHKPPAN